jgi:transcription elongation factor Elf1
LGGDAVTEGAGGKVPPSLACPRCGADDVDDLMIDDPADDDPEPDRAVVTCEKCGLRYRLGSSSVGEEGA